MQLDNHGSATINKNFQDHCHQHCDQTTLGKVHATWKVVSEGDYSNMPLVVCAKVPKESAKHADTQVLEPTALSNWVTTPTPNLALPKWYTMWFRLTMWQTNGPCVAATGSSATAWPYSTEYTTESGRHSRSDDQRCMGNS